MKRIMIICLLLSSFATLLFSQQTPKESEDAAKLLNIYQMEDLRKEIEIFRTQLLNLKAERQHFESEKDEKRVRELNQRIDESEDRIRALVTELVAMQVKVQGKKKEFFLGDSPRIAELEQESKKLGLEFQSADKQKQKEILDRLETAVNELFDLREEQKKEEIKQLQKRVEELNETLKERQIHKKEIVQRRIDELTGKKGIYSWD